MCVWCVCVPVCCIALYIVQTDHLSLHSSSLKCVLQVSTWYQENSNNEPASQNERAQLFRNSLIAQINSKYSFSHNTFSKMIVFAAAENVSVFAKICSKDCVMNYEDGRCMRYELWWKCCNVEKYIHTVAILLLYAWECASYFQYECGMESMAVRVSK